MNVNQKVTFRKGASLNILKYLRTNIEWFFRLIEYVREVIRTFLNEADERLLVMKAYSKNEKYTKDGFYCVSLKSSCKIAIAARPAKRSKTHSGRLRYSSVQEILAHSPEPENTVWNTSVKGKASSK